MEYIRESILAMARGAFMERADYEMGKVIANILDPNTKPTAKRKINVQVEITPDESRTGFRTDVTAKSTLAPATAVTTSMSIVADPSSGELVIVENVPQVPGQTALDGTEQAEPKILKFAQV